MIVFDRRTAEELAAIAQARVASADVSLMAGINVAIKQTRYGSGYVQVTLEFTEAGRDRAREVFEQHAQWIGLKPEDYGREIRVGHEMFVIAGINLGRPKFPIDIRRVRDGKMFKLTEAGAQRALNNP